MLTLRDLLLWNSLKREEKIEQKQTITSSYQYNRDRLDHVFPVWESGEARNGSGSSEYREPYGLS